MIPDLICVHFGTIPPRCEAGRIGGRDCPSCAAYRDGSAFLGYDVLDQDRIRAWAELPRLPVAHLKVGR
jgi:hypothetical protein